MAKAFFLVAATVLAAAAAGAIAACSSSDTPAGTEDAGADTTAPPPVDAAPDVITPVDAGRDVARSDAGHCSAIQGACDIVAQDCDAGTECFEVLADGGKWTTACIPTTPNSRIAKGGACCPGAAANPCLPGLECLGEPCVADAASPTARCAPRCCAGDDAFCGSSPEGFHGLCDTDITGPLPDGGTQELFFLCTYTEVCRPFGLAPCPSGFGCLVTDNHGSAKCSQIYDPNGPAKGLAEGQPCTFANECADGLMCLGASQASATCQMLCITPGSMPPFDAGALALGPGTGGCNTGKTCTGGLDPSQFPAWLSICR